MCDICDKNPPDRKITYGLYAEYERGRPHHVLKLCEGCAHDLWSGTSCAPLRPLVTAGLAHFVVEPLNESNKST